MDTEFIKLHKHNPKKFLFTVYLANLFLSFHIFLILYINSSFLESFFSSTYLSLLYILGSLCNLFLLLYSPKIIKTFGNYKLTLTLITLEAVAILGLAMSESLLLISFFFILHLTIIMVLLFNLDVFLEGYTESDESKTGSIRGTFLTISNLTLVISPSITGLILTNGDYFKVYLISFLFLIPLFFTVKLGLKKSIETIKYVNMKFAFQKLVHDKDSYGVFMVQVILQLFYAWMVIYMPIHLHQNLGFSWTEIGVMFTIMLLPFVLFEYPLGKLADKKLGEKEIMTTGFIITAIFVALIPFLNNPSFIIWIGLLFMTRVGASFIEISSESYFFKHVNSKDSDMISLFRITRPIAFILTPLIGATAFLLLNYYSLQYSLSFLILSIITLCGIRYSLMIKDTK